MKYYGNFYFCIVNHVVFKVLTADIYVPYAAINYTISTYKILYYILAINLLFNSSYYCTHQCLPIKEVFYFNELFTQGREVFYLKFFTQGIKIAFTFICL